MFAGYRFSAVAALLLATSCYVAAQQSTTLTQQDYNNICLLTYNGEMIATGNSCNQYYFCQNGVAILQTCPEGFSFSKDGQTCMPASAVNCGQIGVDPCTSANIGQWAPVAGSCSGFYYCSATGGMRGNCPLGENFNPQTQSCEFATTYPCGIINGPGTGDNTGSGEVTGETGVNLCAFMPNGLFFGSASSCAAYNYCQNNALQTGTCPNGYNFNPAIGKCDYIENVSCSQVSNDPNLINSPSIGGPCTQSGTMKAAAQCNGFYVCNGINFVLNFCNTGQFFDTVSLTCVPRLNARNNCDRCVGSTLSFVNAYSNTGCTGYLYCQNGVEKSVGTCASGSYFDEIAGACVIGVQPDYGCCNPAFYGGGSSPPSGGDISGPPGPGSTTSSTTTTTTTTTTTVKPDDTDGNGAAPAGTT